jgi:hypothetical protein
MNVVVARKATITVRTSFRKITLFVRSVQQFVHDVWTLPFSTQMYTSGRPFATSVVQADPRHAHNKRDNDADRIRSVKVVLGSARKIELTQHELERT